MLDLEKVKNTPPPLPDEVRPRLRTEARVALEELREFAPRDLKVEIKETPFSRVAVTKLAKGEVFQINPDAEPSQDSYCLIPEEEMAIVADGAGGSFGGKFASEFVTNSARIREALDRARETIQQKTEAGRLTLLDEIAEDNQFIDALEAQTQPLTIGKRRAETIAQIKEEMNRVNPPEKVRLEAMAVYQMIHDLSRQLSQAGTTAAREHFKSLTEPEEDQLPKTTLVGYKIIMENDRCFGIFFGVGDSCARISKPDLNDPSHKKTQRIIPSDGLAEVMIDRGQATKATFNRTDQAFVYNAVFKACTQFVGQNEKKYGSIRPHVAVVELPPGTDILLASDGLEDSDRAKNFETTLVSSETPASKVETVTNRAIRGFRDGEGAQEPDDITVLIAAIRDYDYALPFPETELNWATLIDQALREAGARGDEERELRELLLDDQNRDKIIRAATQAIEKQGEASDAAVTALLKTEISRFIDRHRVEKTERKFGAAA